MPHFSFNVKGQKRIYDNYVITFKADRVIFLSSQMELLVLVLLLQLLVLRFRNSSETEKVENFFADKFPIFRVQELELRLVVSWNRHKTFS